MYPTHLWKVPSEAQSSAMVLQTLQVFIIKIHRKSVAYVENIICFFVAHIYPKESVLLHYSILIYTAPKMKASSDRKQPRLMMIIKTLGLDKQSRKGS